MKTEKVHPQSHTGSSETSQVPEPGIQTQF